MKASSRSARSQPRPDPAAVLTRAVLRAGERLGLSGQQLADVLGVSPASLSRLRGGRTIDPASKEGELAALFLRVFRSLDALLGGDGDGPRRWLHAYNHHLAAVPAEAICGVRGLVDVAAYLDAMRGKV